MTKGLTRNPLCRKGFFFGHREQQPSMEGKQWQHEVWCGQNYKQLLAHITEERNQQKWVLIISFKAQPQMIDIFQLNPTSQRSITSLKNATSWWPSAQTHGPERDNLCLNHSKGMSKTHSNPKLLCWQFL